MSLLNVDVKDLAKVLAVRLEVVRPNIILVSINRLDLLKVVIFFSNICTLMNIIYSRQTSKLPEVVISLDAEKTFDRTEWEYLFAAFKKKWLWFSFYLMDLSSIY